MRTTFGLVLRASALLVVAVVGGVAAGALGHETGPQAPPAGGTTTVLSATAGTEAAPASTRPGPAATQQRPPVDTFLPGQVDSTGQRPSQSEPQVASAPPAQDAPVGTPSTASGAAPPPTAAPATPAPPSPPSAQFVPNVVGQTYPEAEKVLRRAGFEVLVSAVTTLDASRDLRVLYQSPPPGQTAPRQTRVVLTVERYIPTPPDPRTTG